MEGSYLVYHKTICNFLNTFRYFKNLPFRFLIRYPIPFQLSYFAIYTAYFYSNFCRKIRMCTIDGYNDYIMCIIMGIIIPHIMHTKM